MATVNGQVIIAGGWDGGNPTNQVWVLDGQTNTWTQPFPAMPTVRWGVLSNGLQEVGTGGGGDIVRNVWRC